MYNNVTIDCVRSIIELAVTVLSHVSVAKRHDSRFSNDRLSASYTGNGGKPGYNCLIYIL